MVLSLRVLQSQSWLPVGIFNLDDSMSLELVHGENISDVLYDCGTKGVRIDWESKKFCWLNLESDESYYFQINKLIVSSQTTLSTILYLEDNCGGFADDPFVELLKLNPPTTSRRRLLAPDSPDPPANGNREGLEGFMRLNINDRAFAISALALHFLDLSQEDQIESVNFSTGYPIVRYASGQIATSPTSAENDGRLLLESDGKYIVVGKSNDDKFYALFPVCNHEWFMVKNYVKYDERSFIATALGSNIFILTKKLRFIQFNYETNVYKKTAPFNGNVLKFLDLIITSRQDNDNKIVLIDKSCGKIHIFNIDSQTWTETSISNRAPKQTDPKDCIMAATSVFLPLNKIKYCCERNSVYQII